MASSFLLALALLSAAVAVAINVRKRSKSKRCPRSRRGAKFNSWRFLVIHQKATDSTYASYLNVESGDNKSGSFPHTTCIL
jgi:hypothetical protein